jgi:rubrerythrin
MNVFDYAMKMETDGRDFYLEHAGKVSTPELKQILLQLADDELKHFNIFKAMRDHGKAEYKEAQKTMILKTVKNVFETMRKQKKEFTFAAEATQIWKEAREVEKKSEAFYREKAKEMTDDNLKHVWQHIADEEHRHWVTIENVIQFLDRPKNWLEDAEWSHLEDY